MFSFFVPRLLRRMSVPQKGLQGAVARFQAKKLVQLAVCESIFLYGFCGAFLAHDPWLYVPFLVLGELLMMVHFPRQSVLEATLSDRELCELASLSRGFPSA